MRTNKDKERMRLLLLLSQGVPFPFVSKIPPRPQFKATVSQATIDANMAKAYPNFSQHDWGPFGKYEYLGPGTPYTQKSKAGIKSRNDLDRLAMMHDSQYQMTEDRNYAPGLGIMKSGERGLYDYGAGAAMMTAAFNPWSDLDFTDRVLAFAAGEALMIQGAIRLSPPTYIVGIVLDILFY